MMSSAVEQDCNKNTVGFFAKLHQESTLQPSWPPSRIPNADVTTTTISKETTTGRPSCPVPYITTAILRGYSPRIDPATAFSSYKRPFEATSVPDLVVADRCQPTGFNQRVDSVDGNHSMCNVSEPLQADGPSTPMRYLPRSKYVSAETPENIFYVSPCSLATGSSCLADKEVAKVEKCTESNTACFSEALRHHQPHPMKLSQRASTLENSYRRTISEVKQEGPELHDESTVSVVLDKPNRVKQLMQKSNSSHIQSFGSLAMTKMSMSEGIDVQHQDVYEQMTSQMHVSPICSKVDMGDSLQSFRSIPRKVGFTKCQPLHLKTEQDIICSGNQQETQTVRSADLTRRSASIEPCVPWQPVTHTFSVLRCENTFQGSTSTLRYNDPELTVSAPICATNKWSTCNSPLNHMPILQIPPKANDDRYGLTDEGNPCLYSNDNSMSGKKRKSRNSKIQQEADSAGCLTDETVCSLKVREQSDSLTEETQCFLKARKQPEYDENYLLDKERFSQKKRQGEHISCPNHDPISKDPLKKHIMFTGTVEGCLPDSKTVKELADSKNIMGKLGQLEQSIALELNGNGALDSLVSMGQLYSSGPDIQRQHGLILGKISSTLSPEGAKPEALSTQPIIGNTMQLPTLGGQRKSLQLKTLTFPAYSPMPAALSTFSSGGPSLPQIMVHTGGLGDSSIGGKTASREKKTSEKMTSPETDWGKFLALSATPETNAQVDQSKKETLVPYQQRFIKLQSFLKQCDEPDEEYLQTVRSLSAIARSGHAVALETRAIMLSLEEGKELHRMKMLNVFGKDFQSSTNDAGSTPQGPRLPAPGAGKTLKLVS